MKKYSLLTVLLLSIFTFNSCKDRVVYVNKPTVNDSTVLIAKMKVSQWNEVIYTIIGQAKKLQTQKLDSIKAIKSTDTLQSAINYLVKNIQDSTINDIYKK